MYGAIIGDIVGSRFEFDRGGKKKDFRLFTKYNKFTDDTVMTVAVADALLYSGKDADIETIKKNVINSMVHWAKKYPNAGYGGRFYQWLFHTKERKPYGSYGNGSAMRVSAVGWLYDSLERTSEVARATAEVTHNHPEGVKGATCTAEVIFLARTGLDKENIREYVEETYDYDINTTVDQLRIKHEHIESCQDSMPKALVSFFEGESFEDVIRNAVSLGGDTDTLAAIAGAMAEAYYGITLGILADASAYIPADINKIIEIFTKAKDSQDNFSNYENNKYIKLAVDEYYKNSSIDNLELIAQVLIKRMEDQGTVPAPMIDVNNSWNQVNFDDLKVGDNISLNNELRLKLDTVTNEKGEVWVPLFTDEEEVYKKPTSNIIFETQIEFILRCGLNNENFLGIVINPFSENPFAMHKDLLKPIIDYIDHSSPTNGNE